MTKPQPHIFATKKELAELEERMSFELKEALAAQDKKMLDSNQKVMDAIAELIKKIDPVINIYKNINTFGKWMVVILTFFTLVFGFITTARGGFSAIKDLLK